MRPPLKLLSRRAGAVGIALTAYDIWRMIPPKHRRRLLAEARTHGPRLARNLVEQRLRGRGAPRRPRR